MLTIAQLTNTIDSWLKPKNFRDYCPNGLQVGGSKETVTRLACAVTASQYVIEQAIAADADVLLVHHGIFWKGDSPVIVGSKRKRIHSLLTSGIHLLGYHLPLDAHAELGNNVQLAHKLGLIEDRRVPHQPDSLLCIGHTETPVTAQQLCKTIEQQLGRTPQCIGDTHHILERIAWCTGGAQSFFGQAIEEGADAYITGEISEQNYHQALESGSCFIAAGHHATERYGVQALADRLSQEFQLNTFFIEENNPV